MKKKISDPVPQCMKMHYAFRLRKSYFSLQSSHANTRQPVQYAAKALPTTDFDFL